MRKPSTFVCVRIKSVSNSSPPTNQFAYIAMKAKRFQFIFFLYFVLNESLYFDEFNYIERQKPNYFTLNEKNKYGYCTWTRFICNSGTHFDLQVNKKVCKYFIKNRFIMNWLYFSWIHLQLNKSIAYCIRHRIYELFKINRCQALILSIVTIWCDLN